MFLLTKEQQKLRAELREFVDHEVCPVATELDNRGGFPHELYARIGKMGYLDAEFDPDRWTPKFKVIQTWNKAFPKQ